MCLNELKMEIVLIADTSLMFRMGLFFYRDGNWNRREEERKVLLD